MKVLVDIGNSRLKWVTVIDGQLSRVHAQDYRQAHYLTGLRQDWLRLPTPDTIMLASVAAQHILGEIECLVAGLWPSADCRVIRSSAQAGGVSNAYPQPEKLGVDRWLALLAGHRHYSGEICIVDCGTAITVDVVAADGQHRGGLISPGLSLMTSALVQNAAALQGNDLQPSTDLANNTHAAIANGVLLAAVGLIERVLQRQAVNCRLIITGGDAEQIAGALLPAAMIDKHLVFKGMVLLAEEEQTA